MIRVFNPKHFGACIPIPIRQERDLLHSPSRKSALRVGVERTPHNAAEHSSAGPNPPEGRYPLEGEACLGGIGRTSSSLSRPSTPPSPSRRRYSVDGRGRYTSFRSWLILREAGLGRRRASFPLAPCSPRYELEGYDQAKDPALAARSSPPFRSRVSWVAAMSPRSGWGDWGSKLSDHRRWMLYRDCLPVPPSPPNAREMKGRATRAEEMKIMLSARPPPRSSFASGNLGILEWGTRAVCG